MKIDQVVNVYDYSFDESISSPEDANDKIFIPCWGLDFKHCYFLIDFKKKCIKAFEIDLTDYINSIREDLFKIHDDQTSPNGMTFDQLLMWMTSPHQGEFFDNKIFIYLNYAPFFVSIDLSTDICALIFDETDAAKQVYSSTNQIVGGMMYLSRWHLKDMYKEDGTYDNLLDVELIKYNVSKDKFEIIDTIKGRDRIHTTSVSEDNRNIILIEMNTIPKINNKLQNADTEVRKKVLEEGLHDSNIFIYNIQNRKARQIIIEGAPAHIAFDKINHNIVYISRHELGVIGVDAYSFGYGSIMKFRVTDEGNLNYITEYKNEDTVRLPGHVSFSYKGKNLIATPATHNKVLLVDSERMDTYGKILLRKQIKIVDYENGPVMYQPMLLDKTPYSAQIKDESSYLYINNLTTVGIYNFVEDKPICDFRYNYGATVIGCGHSLMING